MCSIQVYRNGIFFFEAAATYCKGCSAVGEIEYEDPLRQHLVLKGGGFCGRFCSEEDLTKDEKARPGDYDNEVLTYLFTKVQGSNGGWVLQLKYIE